MRTISRGRFFLTYFTYTALAAFSWSVAAVVPPTALAVERPLKSATKSKEAKMAVDGTQRTPLPTSSNSADAGVGGEIAANVANFPVGLKPPPPGHQKGRKGASPHHP